MATNYAREWKQQAVAYLRKNLLTSSHLAPLSVFRIVWGVTMAFSTLRYLSLGWVDKLLIDPVFHFTYYGFEWIQPMEENGIYLVFAGLILSSLFITVGLFYRVSCTVFFLLFTYVELIDKAYYLNHYYFVSIVSLLMIVLPANLYYSIDALRRPDIKQSKAPAWTIKALQLQLFIVYVFAGIAKINSDWLLEALPLKIWLPAKDYLPLIGPLLREKAVPYLFSWAGMLYDILVPFLLLGKRTRAFAYLTVVIFHILTGILFQIGVFPMVMISATLIFFPASFHRKIIVVIRFAIRKIGTKIGLDGLKKILPSFKRSKPHSLYLVQKKPLGKITDKFWSQTRRFFDATIKIALVSHFLIQLLLPLRYLLYPGNLFWTEQGYRFSWRVMLIEKSGYATFHVKDKKTMRTTTIDNREWLTTSQEKQMSMQPDMILQFAHHLKSHFARQNHKDIAVYAHVYVTLNGREEQLLIDTTIDLTQEEEDNLFHKEWILPFKKDL